MGNRRHQSIRERRWKDGYYSSYDVTNTQLGMTVDWIPQGSPWTRLPYSLTAIFDQQYSWWTMMFSPIKFVPFALFQLSFKIPMTWLQQGAAQSLVLITSKLSVVVLITVSLMQSATLTIRFWFHSDKVGNNRGWSTRLIEWQVIKNERIAWEKINEAMTWVN